ncbi:Pyroglutamyl-peptidase [Cyanidiococcus yangmingshanensis]|uniref:Pyroglutamyl-peptidase n=1 Tax=Cyanidiococcus yangmingshanensis TaxID=2690220 RepID=A0A7J7ID24_9RHOD|nr:Pyroglutamyl-peptidase [Cyanidiococcus yangmingshanensis]
MQKTELLAPKSGSGIQTSADSVDDCQAPGALEQGVAQGTSFDDHNALPAVSHPRKLTETPVTHFYITGFGRFALIEDNPTETIVHRLRAMFEDSTVQAAWRQRLVHIADLQVLKVSATAVHEAIADMKARCIKAQQALKSSPCAGRNPVCFIHLGVDVSADGFSIERVAVNEAMFRFPDECGWQPTIPVPVVDTEPLGAQYTHDLDALSAICARTRSRLLERGLNSSPIRIGNDAGRFLCNYLFYLSAHERVLSNGEILWQTHFVHCPTTRVASLENQMETLLAFLCAIAEWNAQHDIAN